MKNIEDNIYNKIVMLVYNNLYNVIYYKLNNKDFYFTIQYNLFDVNNLMYRTINKL